MTALQEKMQGKPQLSDLPLLTRYVTGNDPETGVAIVKVKDNGRWQHFGSGILGYNVLYSTKYPESLQNNGDLERHKAIQDTGKLGTVRPNGTVLRVCEFSPGYPGKIHVTRSIDYGIVLEGTVDMILDSGEVHVLKRGDIVVQRATLHQWQNLGTEWARMAFILQDVQDFEVNREKIKEDMGKRDYYIAPSGNTE